jgi:triosephosphate isomerase
MTRRKLIAGNWKMNGSLAANAALLTALRAADAGAADLLVCVPFVYLAQAQSLLEGSAVGWGAQDCSAHAQGAYTGEVSAAMLRDFSATHVILGHSERRQYHAESDERVAAKAAAALDAGLVPIVCVGETLAEREAGQTEAVVARQLQAVLARLGPQAARIVIAYEPVWAIGTGRVATPAQAQQVHAAIRAQLQGAIGGPSQDVRLLYGGSMKPDNAGELLRQPDIDGGLIGGASLKAADFLSIAAAASR